MKSATRVSLAGGNPDPTGVIVVTELVMEPAYGVIWRPRSGLPFWDIRWRVCRGNGSMPL